MSTELWAALIAGPVTAIVTGLVTYLFSPERRHRTLLGGPRRHALAGRWCGTLAQPASIAGFSGQTEVELNLKAGIRTVYGDGRIKFVFDGVTQQADFSLRGGFTYLNFFRFAYTNTKSEVVQFGSGVLELNPAATELRGHIVGYGALSKKVIAAELVLTKVA